MEYRTLGHTNLKISLIGLGTMTWGLQNSAAEGFEQMDYALDHGVNFFDTAEMYAIPPCDVLKTGTDVYPANKKIRISYNRCLSEQN